jgi:hypothetical protein
MRDDKPDSMILGLRDKFEGARFSLVSGHLIELSDWHPHR